MGSFVFASFIFKKKLNYLIHSLISEDEDTHTHIQTTRMDRIFAVPIGRVCAV